MNYFNSMMFPVIFFLILAPLSNAQTASTKGSPALRTQFNRTILIAVDSDTDLFKNATDALVDSADVLSDSLAAFEETLIDKKSEEMDSLEEHSNKLIVSIDGNSHASFRGRDGGISQGLLTPSITLRLLSGIRILSGAGWTGKPEFHRDDSYLGISYDFRVSPTLGAAIGYSYLWFADSSTQNQSVFHHSIDGALSLETSIVNLGTGIGIFIGSEVEFAVTASASRNIPIGKISIEPTLTISWGEQNGVLTAQRLLKTSQAKGNGKGKGNGNGIGNGGGQQSVVTTTTSPTNVFSIMSYEIHLPLNIKIGRLLLTPSVTGIFPSNVIDGSRSRSVPQCWINCDN
jgi:hypothetical protein